MTTRKPLMILAVLALISTNALADDKKLVGKKKESAPKLDLGIPAFKEIPADLKLEKAKEKDTQSGPSAHSDEGYTVLRVVHAKTFMASPEGAKPSSPMAQIPVTGNPLTTEKFNSSVRVKAPGRRNTRIEVAFLDARGDTVMEATGELVFNPKEKSDETDWNVEWAPTSVRAAGEFSVLVRIGGNPAGTFPIKFAETPK